MTPTGLLHDSAVALAILLAVLGLGHWLMRLLRLDDRNPTVLWLATTCGFGVLSVGTLLIGLARLLYPWLVAMLLAPLVLTGVIVAVTWLKRWRHGRFLPAWGESDRPFRVYAYLLLFLILSTILWITVATAVMPPRSTDEVIFQLTLPKLFVKAHAVTFVPSINLSLWPMNSQMLFTLSLLLGSDIAHHLLMLAMTVWTGLGLLLVSRRHFDDRVGIIAVALFITVPIVKATAGTGMIDVSLGLYVLASLVALDSWQRTRNRAWLAVCGACCGFAAGSKLSGAAFPLLVGVPVLVDELRRRPLRIRTAIGDGILFCLAALLMAGPWYARSWLATGNPVWPSFYDVFGGRSWDALGDARFSGTRHFVSLELPRTPEGLVRSFAYLLTRTQEMGGYPGGIGVVIPLGALACAMLVTRGPRFLRHILFVCAGFYLLWFSLIPMELRYLMPIVPLLALATAYLFVRVYDRVRLSPLRIAALAGLLVLLLIEWPWASASDLDLLRLRFPYLIGQVSREEWLETQFDIMPILRYANTQLPDDARILLVPYENRTYYLERDYVWGCLTCQRVIPFERFETPAELEDALQAMGITYVIDNPAYARQFYFYDHLPYWDHDRALMEQLRDQCGRPLARSGEAVLYALTDCVTPVNNKDTG